MGYALARDDDDDTVTESEKKPTNNSSLFAPRLRLVGRTKATYSWWCEPDPNAKDPIPPPGPIGFTSFAEKTQVERMRDGACASTVMGIALE